jgi:hypothetical protein
MSKRPPPPVCMCDFPDDCGGLGFVECRGCGGDLCICAACYGHGEQECQGCDECPRDDEDLEP